ncbi:MAG: cupin fold metalloprotein, WbuC family [Bacteroidetes bacterium HGW-Bacteroidetes-1]|nr:MAG: cupin fold metalloprotein, WbuC family [Bacteroidetes bacterium HGW-Bacteroidetes-1]
MIRIDERFIETISEKAKLSSRRRMNFNFHPTEEDTLQRMLNAMEPDTYIQPHKHEMPDKTEVFFCLRGRILVVEYADSGTIADHIILDSKQGNFGCEIAARIWHSIISLESGSVAYEVKHGPYEPSVDKHFATWAPKEGDPAGTLFNQKILEILNLDE